MTEGKAVWLLYACLGCCAAAAAVWLSVETWRLLKPAPAHVKHAAAQAGDVELGCGESPVPVWRAVYQPDGPTIALACRQ